MADNRVIVFDTTLRDGEQSPGFSMNRDEKLRMAEAIAGLGVDVIEAGFPVASPDDFESVRAIAGTAKGPVIAALCRAAEKDILAAAEALKPAERRRIHTFISTSPLHMEHKLRMSPEQVIEAIRASVTLARNHAADVEWSAEDGTRTEDDFLCRAVETAIRGGRHHHQHPRHRRLRRARGPVPHLRHAARAGAGRGRRDLLHPQPQRPRPCRRQRGGRGEGRRAPDRVHRQRHRRAGGQRLAGRVRHGAAHASGRAAVHDRGGDDADPEDLAPALGDHRPRRAAEQGDRGPQRLRPRERHPPGRHAEERGDLRDHDARERRLVEVEPGAGQALRPRGLPRQAGRPGLRARRERVERRLRPLQGARRRQEGRLRGRHHRPGRRGGDPRERAHPLRFARGARRIEERAVGGRDARDRRGGGLGRGERGRGGGRRLQCDPPGLPARGAPDPVQRARGDGRDGRPGQDHRAPARRTAASSTARARTSTPSSRRPGPMCTR